jgi:hypothetical protein
VDNAHFGHVLEPNLLVNGDFELDTWNGEFAGWNQPATWPFPPSNMTPLDNNNCYGDPFDAGGYRPYFGYRWAYGYDTWLHGEWVNDAFTFGQVRDVSLPPGSELVLSFYWVQGVKGGNDEGDLRRPLGSVQLAVEYLSGDTSLRADEIGVAWPVAANPANVSPKDQNAHRAFNVHRRLYPPAGTDRIGFHARLATHAYPPAGELFAQVVDDFYLRVIPPVESPTPAPTNTPGNTPTPTRPPYDDFDGDLVPDEVERFQAPEAGRTNAYLPDSDGDGLSDGEEDANRDGSHDAGIETNARSRDTDGDRYEDAVELLIPGGNPLDGQLPVSDYTDEDEDGLPTSFDPQGNNPDKDADRFTDGYEAVYLGFAAAEDPAQMPLLGDVNGDGIWDNADAQIILNFFAGQAAPGLHHDRTDVDRNANIDNGDAQFSLIFFARILDLLPAR